MLQPEYSTQARHYCKMTMGRCQIYMRRNHQIAPKIITWSFPQHQILALALNPIANTIRKSSRSQYVRFHIHTIEDIGISYETISQIRTLQQYSNAPPRSEDGIEAVKNVSGGLEPDDLSESTAAAIVRVGFSGSKSKSSRHGTVVA